MHERERRRRQIGELSYSCSSGWREATGVKEFLGFSGGLHDVLCRERRSVSSVSEEIPAKQGAGGLLKQDPRFPTVRHMRSIDVTDSPLSQVNDFAVLNPHFADQRPVGEFEDGRALGKAFELDDIHQTLALDAAKTTVGFLVDQ